MFGSASHSPTDKVPWCAVVWCAVLCSEDEEEQKYEEEEEEDKKPRRRIPYYSGPYPDPVDTTYSAHPSCHVSFSPYYNEKEYKFGCLAEKSREVVAGTERRPTKIK